MSVWKLITERARNSESDDLDFILSEVEVILEEFRLLIDSLCESCDDNNEGDDDDGVKFGRNVRKFLGETSKFRRKNCGKNDGTPDNRAGRKKAAKANKKYTKCEKCGGIYSSKRWMKTHKAKCKGLKMSKPKWVKNDDGRFKCAVQNCSINETFDGMYGLRSHFYSFHVADDEKAFICQICDEKFARRNQLNEHSRLKHQKRHECDVCGKKFGEKVKLKSHLLTHTGERPFPCDVCGYAAAKKYNLDAHKKAKHGDDGGRSCTCEICGKLFKTFSTLKGHITAVHRKKARAKSLNLQKDDGLNIEVHEIEMVNQLFMDFGSGGEQQSTSELPNLPSDLLPSLLQSNNQ